MSLLSLSIERACACVRYFVQTVTTTLAHKCLHSLILDDAAEAKKNQLILLCCVRICVRMCSQTVCAAATTSEISAQSVTAALRKETQQLHVTQQTACVRHPRAARTH
jgi:hypothetical protein